MAIDAAARSRIDRFLGRVEAHLADRSEDEREELIHDLEAHLYDALAGRDSQTVADVEAVLSEMDPPETYGSRAASREAPPTPAPASGLKWAGGLSLAGFVGLLLVAVAVDFLQPDRRTSPESGWMLFWTGQLAALAVLLGSAWNRLTPVPPAERGPAYGRISFLMLCASVVLFAAIALHVDRHATLIPILVTAGIATLVLAYGFGRASHASIRLPAMGRIQRLGRIALTLGSVIILLGMIALPLAACLGHRTVTVTSSIHAVEYCSWTMPHPFAWGAKGLFVAGVLALGLALVRRLSGIGVRGLLWPLLGRTKKDGNRAAAVLGVVLLGLAAASYVVYLVLPPATP